LNPDGGTTEAEIMRWGNAVSPRSPLYHCLGAT